MVVLVVSHCCISAASVDRIGLSGDQQVNQKRIWTSGLWIKQVVFYYYPEIPWWNLFWISLALKWQFCSGHDALSFNTITPQQTCSAALCLFYYHTSCADKPFFTHFSVQGSECKQPHSNHQGGFRRTETSASVVSVILIYILLSFLCYFARTLMHNSDKQHLVIPTSFPPKNTNTQRFNSFSIGLIQPSELPHAALRL